LNKNRIVYISDLFLSDIVGGGELNDHELLRLLELKNFSIKKERSHKVSLPFVQENIDSCFIISNFINLSDRVKDFLQAECAYIIYEHDHKYLKSRNPAAYKDFIAPKSELININFYKNAKSVFCQSSFHKGIIEKNLDIDNVVNISGNLWTKEALNTMKILSKKPKNSAYSIMNSPIPHKNTKEAVFYCEKKGLEYALISSPNYQEFLSLLSNNDKFMFLPKTPETLSRVVVEARMMGIKTVTNKNIGASYEPWFSLKGEDLIKVIENKRQEIPNLVIGAFNER